MTFRIGKTYAFAASHQLEHLPKTHKCARLHGHNYTVEVILEADDIDERGFVVDYAELDEWASNSILRRLDHQHLNDVMGSSIMTTAEAIAASLWASASAWFAPAIVRCVTVRETDKTFATYDGNEHAEEATL